MSFNREEGMRKLLGFALAAGALAVGAAFVGTAKAPSATAAGINCASSAGVAYFGPTTGPVASIGAELRALANLGVNDFHLLLAAPAPMAVAIGRQLHALGRVSLYYANADRQPVRAFTLNL